MSSLDEKLFPELLLFEPGRERRRMMRRVFRNTRTVAAFGLAVVIFVYGVDGPLRSYLGRLGLPHWAVTVIAALCAGGMAYAAIWVTRRGVRRYLRVQLVNKGVPVCLECGYQLRGQVEPRCPECGTGFDMRLLDQDHAVKEATDIEWTPPETETDHQAEADV